jgi:hypothetical protein
MPSPEQPDRSGEAADTHPSPKAGAIRFETRSRQEYYDAMRAALPRQPQDAARPPLHERDANGKPWTETTDWCQREWAECQTKYPPEERPPVDSSNDPPGSWRGAPDRFLDQPANGRVEHWYDRNKQCEKDKTSPSMQSIEAADPDRYLAGFEYRLKGPDRLKEKVAQTMKEERATADEALSFVKDAIRYTFVYKSDHYADGVKSDIGRMKENGFEQVDQRNSWESEDYKGINSRWREPTTGLLFEVQFHTKVSYEAKQLTHGAYERLRSRQASEPERVKLDTFQRRVFGAVPTPPGATVIPNYPERD